VVFQPPILSIFDQLHVGVAIIGPRALVLIKVNAAAVLGFWAVPPGI
jgi:hypothetical protein